MREINNLPQSEQDLRAANKLLKRGLRLEYLTLGWNVIGSVIVILSGLQANSVALVGFALDSLIEIGASTVVIWQLTGISQQREKSALRLIGTAFFVLATYILTHSLETLLAQARPNQSPLGIAWLAATFIVMLLLAWGKEVTGKKLGNPVLKTEARVTVVDAYLAGSVLVGLLLNTFFGWWWADPVAGLVIVFYGFKEGWHAWVESSHL
jgi:divalent metal cation (Fe/Co/Zn/Cd) transporter